MVDGRQWKRGDPSGGLADKARAIYGSKHEDFIDNVKAFAYFPYAIAQGVDDFRNGEISMRFQMVDGALDSCAGILFNVKPNGDYLTVRFNGKEDNLVLWTFNKGTRKFVKKAQKICRSNERVVHADRLTGHEVEGYLTAKSRSTIRCPRQLRQSRRLVEDRQRVLRRFHRSYTHAWGRMNPGRLAIGHHQYNGGVSQDRSWSGWRTSNSIVLLSSDVRSRFLCNRQLLTGISATTRTWPPLSCDCAV
jgi:hypothetical protein